MITHSIKMLFACDDGRLVSTSDIVRVLVDAGFVVEDGQGFVIVRRPEPL